MNTKKILTALSLFLIFGSTGALAEDIPAEIPQELVFIRSGDTIIFNGAAPLPEAGTIALVDNGGTSHDINTRSVLGVLASLDAQSDAFSISNLTYYPSFGSLYLKCITTESALCDNWQYAVNGASPSTGMDSTLLSGGERIGIYFGTENRILLTTDSIVAGESVVATAEHYEYFSNTWGPRTGVTIGVTTSNPDDPFSPTVVFSKGVDENGNAEFILSGVGTYEIGIAEDYYFPMVRLNVATAPAVVPTGGGFSSSIILNTPSPSSVSLYNHEKAVEYLRGIQHDDGSFGPDLYTDWVAVALGSADISENAKEKLLAYMRVKSREDMTLTDYERRSMALLSLGENPYAFNGINHIEKITGSFDGTQFGDPELVNDDIFALIPLSSAGYTVSDAEIKSDIAFLIFKQREDGSWEGSVDLTAAAVQALLPFKEIDGVSISLEKAVIFLKDAQKNNGSFGSIYTTSWVYGAMHALGEDWEKNGNGVSDYFAEVQQSDGALLPSNESEENRIWATSYAVAGAHSWREGMHHVAKPEIRFFVESKDILVQKLEGLPVQKAMTDSTVESFIGEPLVGEAPKISEVILTGSAVESGEEVPAVISIIVLGIILGFVIYSQSSKVK